LQAVADFFDVAHGTVQRDWRRAGMPGERGRWNLRDILQWRDSRLHARTSSDETAAELLRRKRAADARVAEAQAEKLERENALRAGELLESRLVMLSANELVLLVKARLEQVPDEIELLMPPEHRTDTRRELESYVDRLLHEMSGWRFNPKDSEAKNGSDDA